MARLSRLFVSCALAAFISACGGVHTAVVTQPAADVVGIKQVNIAPVQVSSAENNPDALALNERWRSMATQELGSALAAKGITASSAPQGTVECKINITYGNRALRYFVGFGAGSGHMRVAIALKDLSGVSRYEVTSDADLAVGAFGGDMSGVASDTIRAAVKDFASRL